MQQGLIDSHLHLLPGGLALTQAKLSGVGSREEFERVVAESATQVQPGAWLLGGGWVEQNWGGEMPDLAWVDEVRQTSKHLYPIRTSAHRWNACWFDRPTSHKPQQSAVCLDQDRA